MGKKIDLPTIEMSTMKGKYYYLIMFVCLLLFAGCKREISFTYEAPFKQNDFKLFFSGLSSDDVTEMPTDGILKGNSLNNIFDKIPIYYLVYKGRLVYFNDIPLNSINNHFSLHFNIHPSQFNKTAILEITYKNKNSSKLNFHKYVVLNLDEGCEDPPDGSWGQAVWREIKDNMN